jgi:hypothetical protein
MLIKLMASGVDHNSGREFRGKPGRAYPKSINISIIRWLELIGYVVALVNIKQ